MSRRYCFILFVLICAAVFSSCGKTDEHEGTKHITNDGVDFTFYYPEDWVLDTNDSKTITVVYGEQSTGSNIYSIRVTENSVGSDFMTAEEYFNKSDSGIFYRYKAQFENNFKLLSTKDDFKLDDVKAFRAEFTISIAKGNDEFDSYHFIQIYALRNGNIYTITCTGKDDDDFNTAVSALDTITEYFKFK